MGGMSIGTSIRKIIDSSRNAITSVAREVKGYRKSPKNDDKPASKEDNKEEIQEEEKNDEES